MLTPAQKVLVQESFAKVEPIAEKAAEIFYGRLFEIDPSLEPLFKGDLKEQGKKLMAMMATVVHGLDNAAPLVPALEALGERHAGYGVSAASYATVGDALLWTLERGLGAAFTDEVRSAWAATYALLSRVMQERTRV
jgi:hemoglobin-like flavoprotein